MSEYSLALCGCELSHLLTLFWRKYIDFGENTLITVRHTVQTSNCCCYFFLEFYNIGESSQIGYISTETM